MIPPSRVTVTAERFLGDFGGWVPDPVSCCPRFKGSLVLDGLVSDLQGRKVFQGRLQGPLDMAEQLGQDLAFRLLNQGARSVLDEIRNQGTDL